MNHLKGVLQCSENQFHFLNSSDFEVKIDLSWIVIAVLITWSLATGLFPNYYKGLPTTTYWWMGIFGALGLFFSIVFHELCHSLVARKFNLEMKGITLFIFGGVAEMEEEPPSPKAEFFMAIAGPLSSILIGIVFYGTRSIAQAGNCAGIYNWSVGLSELP